MNIQQYESIFRPLMTFVVDIMSREVLSLQDNRDRRITFVIDEFGSLAKMSSIFAFFFFFRSKGGFLVLANQDLGSVSNVYGQDQKETFFNNFNIHLTFRLNDPTTSEFLARGFGKREVIKKYRSSSFSPSDLGDRFTLGEQEKVEEIVLPTEFQNLPNFHSYLKIANFGVTKMKTKKVFLPTPQPEFVQRDFKLKRGESKKPAKENK
jgi:type IV secretory pathway TraG/TraD family ATPase VirD4